MSLDITLGQYYDTKSLIHRLDPRTKLFFVIIYIVAIFVAKEIMAFAFLALVLITTIIVSRVPLRVIFKGLKPLTVIIIFTAILNMFITKAQSEPLFSVTIIPNAWTLTLYKEGLINAGILALRIILLILQTSLFFSYATTPIELTDGLEMSLSPLKKIKVPVHEFAMMMTIALRFIPTLVDETSKIMNAQKARGADFSSGGLIKKAKALIPIIIPLFISSFRRAEELATAMECRCYHGGDGRTRMKKLKMKARDYTGLLLTLSILAGVILLNLYTSIYSI
ncbi:MAG: energy-coupling factor transporter transmembrane protein EcfT [Clostridia bacterium]|nr:energy-coupling factor transporter transmembrane protein EcfT [Clostridia bacterium]